MKKNKNAVGAMASDRESLKQLVRKDNVLFVGAHPDDIELGCLGTIMNYLRKGKDITCVIASDGEDGNNNAKKYNRLTESRRSLTGAGLKENDIIFLHLPDRRLEIHKLVMIERLEDIFKKKGINKVFLHTNKETHQDHKTVYEAATSAARNVPAVFIYESNSSTISDFSPKYFINIGPFVDRKVKLLQHHQSQQDKKYMMVDSVAALARHRGTQSKVHAYAEGYEIFRVAED
ncbi:MAG: PIG-L family deacetylase [Candidatus Micrarchaeota archaeon]|nr:PIG-L family deacetylase [Candidatus Micrarchaeota archaeon]